MNGPLAPLGPCAERETMARLVALRAASEYRKPPFAWYLKETGYQGGAPEEAFSVVNAFLNYRPGMRVASMKMTSPPTGVHASPVAMPISRIFSADSETNRTAPR